MFSCRILRVEKEYFCIFPYNYRHLVIFCYSIQLNEKAKHIFR